MSNRGALFGITTGVEQRILPGRGTRDRVRPLLGLREMRLDNRLSTQCQTCSWHCPEVWGSLLPFPNPCRVQESSPLTLGAQQELCLEAVIPWPR